MAAIARNRTARALAAILAAGMLAGAQPLFAAPAHRHRPRPAPTPAALPANVKARLHEYAPGPIPFHDGEQLVFRASWVGIPVAQVRFTLHKKAVARAGDPPGGDPAQWIAQAWVQTNPFADLFFKMRDYVRESIAAGTLRTGGVHIVQHENSRFDIYDVKIDRARDLVIAAKKNHKRTVTKEFISADPWGPLSGAMMALTQPLAAGKSYLFDVFTGGQRYVFAFNVERREQIATPLGDFAAWRIVPQVVYMSDGKLRSEARGTTLWVSADQRHLPLRIESDAFIGTVRADLISVDGHGIADSPQ
ncbi:MAG: DUF3108 domain-containing protein [Candidatus Binataceae bacterium]